MESIVLPEGTVNVTRLVQVHVPAGMLTVVVELVTELNALCTSVALQVAALITCAVAGTNAPDMSNKAMNEIGLMVTVRSPFFTLL